MLSIRCSLLTLSVPQPYVGKHLQSKFAFMILYLALVITGSDYFMSLILDYSHKKLTAQQNEGTPDL